MPRRKQSHPQPLKVGSDPSGPVLESDFLLSRDGGTSWTVGGFHGDRSSSLEPAAPAASAVPTLLCCKACGLSLGVGLALGVELYCLTCEQRRSAPRAIRRSGAPCRLFSCSLCTFTSRYSNHLKRHMTVHDGRKPHRCPVCPYASAQLVNLQRHLRTHTGEKPYGCAQCNYACSSMGNLRRHQRMHAQEEQRNPRRRTKSREELPLGAPEDRSYLQPAGGAGASSVSSSAPPPALTLTLCDLTLEGGAEVQPGQVHPTAALQPRPRETPRLPALHLRLLPPGQPAAPPAGSHGREAVSLRVLQLRLRQPGQPAAPPAHPLGRQAVPLCRLRPSLQPEHEPEAPHAAPHGPQAARLRPLRLRHRPLGQLQAPPEEARRRGRPGARGLRGPWRSSCFLRRPAAVSQSRFSSNTAVPGPDRNRFPTSCQLPASQQNKHCLNLVKLHSVLH